MAESTNSIELGETRKIPVIPVSESWYGFDPIHLQAPCLAQCVAGDACRLASRRRADRKRAAVAVDERVS